MPRPDDDEDYAPRRRRANTDVPCPKCGARSVRSGPWPWYLGTVGAILCRAVICNECGHEYEHLWTKNTLYPRWPAPGAGRRPMTAQDLGRDLAAEVLAGADKRSHITPTEPHTWTPQLRRPALTSSCTVIFQPKAKR